MRIWRYAEGFHAPKGVSADAAGEAVEKWPEPKAMFVASKRSNHILHKKLWSESDKVVADRWRLDYCRKFIASVEEVITIGGKEVTVRAVEFIRTAEDVKGSWHKIGDIIKDSELLASYLLEVEKAQEQTAAKVARVRMLLQEA